MRIPYHTFWRLSIPKFPNLVLTSVMMRGMIWSMDTDKVFIYGLVDPRIGEVFYVGSTVNINARRSQHKSVFTSSKALVRRLAEINAAGMRADFSILEETTHQERDKRELYWIEKLRSEGKTLLNKWRPSSAKQSEGIRRALADKERRRKEDFARWMVWLDSQKATD